MRIPFVLRSRHDADVAALNADRDRLRRRAETAEGHAATAVFNRKQVLRQNAELDAANRRLADRNLELGRRISLLGESDPEYVARLEKRVARLRRAGVRLLAAWAGEKRRADVLQSRLDDALGFYHPGVVEGANWQARRHDKPSTAREAATS